VATEVQAELPRSARLMGAVLAGNRTSHVETAALSVASWGWFFPLIVVSSAGIFLVALGDDQARQSAPSAQPLFWAGLGLTFVPLALRTLAPGCSRLERFASALSLTLLLSLVKPLQQAGTITFYDEFIHWRGLMELQQSGHLFASNPLLPVAAYYPGLESAAAALIGATGLPTPAAAAILIIAARVVLTGALFLFVEQVTGSSRVAGAAVIVYMSNPHFLFFDNQFAYESLALGLAVLVIYLAIRQVRLHRVGAGSWVAIVLTVSAVAVTHHVTSYALLAFLGLWCLLAPVTWRFSGSWTAPLVVTAVVLVVTVTWLLIAARPTLIYLQEGLAPRLSLLISVATNRAAPRQLFQASNGQVAAALWQRALALGFAILIVVTLPFGLWRAWKYHRLNAPLMVLAGCALIFPASLVLHLVPTAAEIADRMSAFVFIGVGCVIGLAVDDAWPARAVHRGKMIAGWLAVVFLGGVIVGWGPPLTLPGPYVVGADSRSVDLVGIAATTWTRDHLGTGNHFAADRTNSNLLATYGDQYPITPYAHRVDTTRLFLSPTFDRTDAAIVLQGRIRYVLVDERLSTALPLLGTFDGYNGVPVPAGQPVPLSWLTKFDDLPEASLIYDNGHIRIYQIAGGDDGQ
jgi:hypothetical protein